jgi:tRNA(adenine34) deaminase
VPHVLAERLSSIDLAFLERVHTLALGAEAAGNLPIAALLADGDAPLSACANRTLSPVLHPGRHAEVEALRLAPEAVWRDPGRLTLYTSLEPCLMCFGAIVLHRLGRVVFGAADPLGGVLGVVPALPAYVREKARAIRWLGPADPERFAPLAARALKLGERHRPAGTTPSLDSA